MGVSYVKFCPRCQTTTAVDSALCPNCGHQFRTHFQAPVSEKTVAMTSVPQAEQSQAGPGPLREVLPEPRPRLRPRFALLGTVALAILGLIYGTHIRHLQQQSVAASKAAFQPYDVVVRASALGTSAPVATQAPEDLQRWQETQTRATESNDAAAGDDPAHVHLYSSKRIVLVPQGSLGRILLEQGTWRRIQILDGLYRGTTGYISQDAVVRVENPAPKASPAQTAAR